MTSRLHKGVSIGLITNKQSTRSPKSTRTPTFKGPLSSSPLSPVGNADESLNESGRDHSDLSPYEQLNRAFEARIRPIADHLGRYSHFLKQFEVPRGMRAKRMSKRRVSL